MSPSLDTPIPHTSARSRLDWTSQFAHKRTPELVFALVFLLYASFALSLGNAPLQDMPNHLARAHILSDLVFNDGATFGHWFKFNFTFTPYLGGDLVLAALDKCFGVSTTARLWIAASILLLPLSVKFALGAQGSSRITAITGSIVAFYLATDWFFVMGFLNYQLSIAMAIFAYGWFLRARNVDRRAPYWLYLTMVLLGYTWHLSALVFVVAIVGTSLLFSIARRELTIWRAATLVMPPIILLAIHLATTSDVAFLHHSNHNTSVSVWGTWSSKLLHMVEPFLRFRLVPEVALFLALLILMCAPIARSLLLHAKIQCESLTLATVFLALYFSCPASAIVSTT